MGVKFDYLLKRFRLKDGGSGAPVDSGSNSEEEIEVGVNFKPESGKIYTHTISDGDTFVFTTPDSSPCTFELHLTKTAASTWTFNNTIWWEKDKKFDPENPAPVVTESGYTYCYTFRWNGSVYLGNLAMMIAIPAAGEE